MAGEAGSIEIVIVVAALEAWSSEAVTVVTPLSSLIESSVRDNVTVGAESSSVIRTSAPVIVKPCTVVEPFTSKVSSDSSTVSWVGSRLKVPVCEDWFAGIEIVKLFTALKSVPEVAVPDSTLTVTGVALPRVPPFRVAVTVMSVALAPSCCCCW